MGECVPSTRGGRLLLLVSTTSYRAGAFLDAARRLGTPVAVASDRRQALADLNPAGHLTLDFNDADRALDAILEAARRDPIAAVIAADDDGAVLAARAAAALGHAGNPVEAVARARDKLRMREALAAAGRFSPAFREASLAEDPERLAREVRYPCVLKPTFLAGSRGVIRVDDARRFAAAFSRVAGIVKQAQAAAPDRDSANRILIEDYVPGAEVAVEGLLMNGRLRVLALFDKPDPLEGPFFEESIYLTPSRLDAARQEMVVGATAHVVAALGLVHGPIHAELRVNGSGAWMLEIAPRSIGGLCSRALRFGDGTSLEELILQQALGIDVGSLEREAAASGVMMIPIPRAGVLREISGVGEARAVEGIEEIRVTIPLGAEVVPLPEGARYLGFLFARAEAPGGVEAALREAHRRLGFVIEAASDAVTKAARA